MGKPLTKADLVSYFALGAIVGFIAGAAVVSTLFWLVPTAS